MKFLHITIAAAFLILTPLLARASLTGLARLSLTEGDVQLMSGGDQEWLPAAINTPLMEGDSVWCPAGSRAEIQLANGAVIRLDGRSSLDIVTLEQDFGQFHLGMGHLYVNTGRMRDRSLQFDIDETSVKVYDRSRFRIDLDDRGGEDISIFKGSVYVESGGANTRVRTGEMLSLEEGHAEISPLAPPDAWESWNRDRDRRLAERRVERSYLPDELSVYADDLDANGRWIEVEEYGYVWQPTVVVEVDWAPYRVGRWCWIRGDYVWISYESWGWAPYHYGRWLHLRGRGWCWVPPRRGDVYWSPGYVGWIVTPTYIGWVPLAPGEIYYGRGYYGRTSLDIARVNLRRSNYTKVVYRNASAANAVAVVERNAFAAGRPVYVRPGRDITTLIRERSTPASPVIRPTSRESRMPIVKPVPRTVLPPPTVGRVPVRELRERHPRLDERRPAVVPGAVRPAEQGRGERVSPPPGEQRPAARPVPAPVPVAPPAERVVPGGRERPAVVPSRPSAPPAVVPPPAAPRGDAARPAARPQVAPPVKRVWKVKPAEQRQQEQREERRPEQREERRQERRQ